MALKIGDSGRIVGLRQLVEGLTAQDIEKAAEEYDRRGRSIDTYEPSSHYDVLINETPYPPKPIFGLAASMLLNESIESQHFTGGLKSTCFNILESLGFSIVEKVEQGSFNRLELHQLYSREDVQKALGPQDTFTTSSGSWGLSGIISDRPSTGDTVLFVTLGEQSGNDYDDAITRDGALIWKSQNRNSADSELIRRLVAHDESQNVVSLFIRTARGREYTYLGALAFQDWDPQSSKPVHMVWKILEWPLPEGLTEQIGLELQPALSPTYRPSAKTKAVGLLLEKTPPRIKPSKPKADRNHQPTGVVDWAAREQANRELGLQGENAVIEWEKDELTKHGRPDLAELVEHTATKNSAAGFDIKSYNASTGAEKYIEVKTTCGSAKTPFFISPNELEKSYELGESYWLYRIYNFGKASGAEFYKLSGDMNEALNLEPSGFKATPKS